MITVLADNAYKAAKDLKAAKKTRLPILACIHLDFFEGRLRLATTDLEKFYVSYAGGKWEGEDWETCVPAKPFIDWLRVTRANNGKRPPFRDDRIHLDLDEPTQILTVKAGNTTARFKCIDGSEFPTIREELIA